MWGCPSSLEGYTVWKTGFNWMPVQQASRTACVQFADPEAPDGIDITLPAFLDGCRKSAVARWQDATQLHAGVRTIVHTQTEAGKPTGSIVLHLHDRAFALWQSVAPGAPTTPRAFVESEIRAVLTELAEQGVHGLIAFTEAQRALFVPDLVQAVTEALGRTSFAKLGREPKIHWEGTLVETVRPPVLTLVVSLGF